MSIEYTRYNSIPKSILRLYSFESKKEKNNDYVNLKRYWENLLELSVGMYTESYSITV